MHSARNLKVLECTELTGPWPCCLVESDCWRGLVRVPQACGWVQSGARLLHTAAKKHRALVSCSGAQKLQSCFHQLIPSIQALCASLCLTVLTYSSFCSPWGHGPDRHWPRLSAPSVLMRWASLSKACFLQGSSPRSDRSHLFPN